MKIVLIGSAYPLRGGLSAFNERLATALQAAGHEVVIYSFSLQYPGFLFPGKTQFTDGPAPAALTIKTVINSVNPLSWLNAGRLIGREAPDMILLKFWLPFMGPAFGTILRVARRKKKATVVCIVDNAIPHEKRPGDRPFTKYLFRRIDRFVVMSKDVLKDLRTLTQKPAVLSPHPLYDTYGAAVNKDAAREKLGLPADKKLVLFFGFIRHYKGLDLLLEAARDVRLKELDVHLLVAGEFYESAEPYEVLFASPELQGRVHRFTDFIAESEVKYFFSAADLVVQPYRSATQSGITQIALHFEKPMVVTHVGGLPEVVPDGKAGFVCEPEPASIAKAILKFFTEGIPDITHNLQAEKQQYSWERFVAVVLSGGQ